MHAIPAAALVVADGAHVRDLGREGLDGVHEAVADPALVDREVVGVVAGVNDAVVEAALGLVGQHGDRGRELPPGVDAQAHVAVARPDALRQTIICEAADCQDWAHG